MGIVSGAMVVACVCSQVSHLKYCSVDEGDWELFVYSLLQYMSCLTDTIAKVSLWLIDLLHFK